MKKIVVVILSILALSACARSDNASQDPIQQTLAVFQTATPAPQNDAGSGADAGCDFKNPLMIDSGETSGSMSLTDKEDCFGFPYLAGDRIEIEIQSPEFLSVSASLTIKNRYIQSQQRDETTSAITYSLGRDALFDGETIARLNLHGISDYRVTLRRSAQNDAGSGRDAPFKVSDITLAPGSTTGFVGYADECDEYYYEPLAQGQTLTVTVIPDKDLDAAITWWGGAGAPPVDVVVLDLHDSDTASAGGVESYTFPAGMLRPVFGVCQYKDTAGEYALILEVS